MKIYETRHCHSNSDKLKKLKVLKREYRRPITDFNLKNIPSKKGKIAIETGANNGIGLETMSGLAARRSWVAGADNVQPRPRRLFSAPFLMPTWTHISEVKFNHLRYFPNLYIRYAQPTFRLNFGLRLYI